MSAKNIFALGLLFLIFCSTTSFGEENSSKEDIDKQHVSAGKTYGAQEMPEGNVNKQFVSDITKRFYGLQEILEEDVNEQLISAVQKGDEKAVEELLKQGADPNTRIYRFDPGMAASSNRPVLTVAASNGYKSIVNQLLSAGARIDEEYSYSHDTGGPWCDHTGMTALLQAVENRQWEVAELLVEKGANVNAVK